MSIVVGLTVDLEDVHTAHRWMVSGKSDTKYAQLSGIFYTMITRKQWNRKTTLQQY